MPKQKWECDRCCKKGVVTFRKGEDVMSVIHLINDSHRKVSPKCEQGVMGIKAPK